MTTQQQVVEERDPGLAQLKAQVYRDERPASYFTRFHERTRTREPDAAYEVVRLLTTLYGMAFFRLRAISSEKVPQSGPVILAPNHFSFMDHFFLGAALRRKVRFMAKSQLFKPPAQWVYTHGGVFPVRRGFRDEEAFITARTILGREGCMAMYCEGGRSRTGALSEKPKPGIGRVALLTGAPIVPVAIHGSSKVRNWKRGQFPQVTVQYGDPIRFQKVEEPTRDQQQSVAEDVFAEIKGLYHGLERLGRRGVLARVRAQRRAERAGRQAATV
jgi:1-acyl-sn-glycerol-3-phosphate acyltransferase